VSSLSIAGTPDAPTALLDLNNNSMIIDYSRSVDSLVGDTRKLIKSL